MKTEFSKLLIIQVSDIHLKNNGNIAAERIGDIAKAVANVEVDLQAVILALCGDIAYSGAQDEYDVAKMCVTALKTELEN